jgi:transaldolase
VDALYTNLEEFRKAYDADGIAVADFDAYGATRRTLRQFLGANNELEALVRDVLLPNPDK